jgi:hypothetical protein
MMWWRLSLIRAISLFRVKVILALVLVVASHGYAASLPTATARHTVDEVLLVYNADSPISTAIAKVYAAKHGVTKAVAIHCADSAVSNTHETISRADYEREIAGPVEEFLSRHQEINFLVLTKRRADSHRWWRDRFSGRAHDWKSTSLGR